MSKGQGGFGICILAAGFSSRMGAFKPLLSIGDQTVVERAIEVSRTVGMKEIVVVTGHNRDLIFPIIHRQKAIEAFNPNFEKGMFTSIQTGVAALSLDLDGFFIMPVDCPLVTEQVLRLMIERFDPGKFTVPCYRGKKGHPLLVPSGYRETILNHDGTGGLKAITDRDFQNMKRVETGFEGVVMDMDTPAAYEEIKAYWDNGCESEDLGALAAGRRFFLIRHGQIRQHEEKIFLGQTDVPLSETGREQARAAARTLAGHVLETDRIYSSDLSRARETAEIIDGQAGLGHFVSVPEFREMSLGPWDGKFISQIKHDFPKEYEIRGQNLMAWKLGHGSENFFDLQYRVIKALVQILKGDTCRDLIIVAHSGVLRTVSNNLKGGDVSDPWVKLGNGEMEILKIPVAGSSECVYNSKVRARHSSAW